MSRDAILLPPAKGRTRGPLREQQRGASDPGKVTSLPRASVSPSVQGVVEIVPNSSLHCQIVLQL